MVCTSFVSDRTQKWVETFFFHYGVKAYNHPCYFLLTGLLLTCLGSIGILNIEYQNRVIDLWIPRNSNIYHNYERTIELFGEYDTDMTIIVSHRENNNLLTPENMNIIYTIFNEAIYNVSVKYNGKYWTFNDLCHRYYSSYPICTSQLSGFFALFGFNPTVWSTQASIQTQINLYESYLQV